MSRIIEDYYAQAKVKPAIVKQRISRFEKHSDILAEFERWIQSKTYKSDGSSVNGFTAQKLAALSEYIDGEGAFMLLVELRENPTKAMRRIADGFKMK